MSDAEHKESNRRGQDVVAGGFLALLGAGASYISLSSLSLGTIDRMGPGMFPLALGVLLFVLGLAMALPSLLKGGFSNPLKKLDVRSFIWISLSILLFAATIPYFGLVPAVTLVVVTSSQSDRVNGPVALISLATVLSLLTYLTFAVGLGLRMPLFAWPW